MRDFLETFLDILVLTIAFFVSVAVAFFPFLLCAALDDARYLLLFLVSIPFVAASILVLSDRY